MLIRIVFKVQTEKVSSGNFTRLLNLSPPWTIARAVRSAGPESLSQFLRRFIPLFPVLGKEIQSLITVIDLGVFSQNINLHTIATARNGHNSATITKCPGIEIPGFRIVETSWLVNCQRWLHSICHRNDGSMWRNRHPRNDRQRRGRSHNETEPSAPERSLGSAG